MRQIRSDTGEGVHKRRHASIGHFEERIAAWELLRTAQRSVLENVRHTGIIVGRGLKSSATTPNVKVDQILAWA